MKKSSKNNKKYSKRPRGLRTWIEISKKAIEHNFRLVKRYSGKAKIMAVAKSNAYGHGLLDFSKCAVACGADWIGVDSIVEAIALRKEKIKKPILVFGYTLPERLADAVAHDISVTVSSFEALENIAKAKLKKPLKIHIKIDTGLHRQGFLSAEYSKLLEKILKYKSKIVFEGAYTHLADVKRREGKKYSLDQIKKFDDFIALARAKGFRPIAHVHASPSLLRHTSKVDTYDMVRVGALLYGLWPSVDVKKDFEKSFPIRPALSWKAIVSETKKLPAGSCIGYNCSYKLKRPSTIAVCPIGYWHGYPGTLSSKGIVLVNDKPANVLGKISMDMIVVDVTDCGAVHAQDIVTLVSDDPKSLISAERIAARAVLSVHEFLTRLNSRIERIYL